MSLSRLMYASRFASSTITLKQILPLSKAAHLYSTQKPSPPRLEAKVEGFQEDLSKRTVKEHLKILLKDYGSTAVVVHICVSLISLGLCYILVKCGADFVYVASNLNFVKSAKHADMAMAGGTFGIAYIIHKMVMPIRITITATATPFIVRALRSKGILKNPPPKD